MDYNQSRAPGPADASVLDTLPGEYLSAMKRTPKGLLALDRLKKFDQKKFRGQFAGVAVKAEAFPGAHGNTQNSDKGITTEISTFNQTAGDRMLGWKAEEILNVTGVHEVCHIVFDDQTWSADTDGCIGTYCPCHTPAIAQELVTRIQFSLIHRARASPRAGWMDSYLRYFALARDLQADATHKRLCKEAQNTEDDAAFAKVAEELRDAESKARKSVVPTAASVEYAKAAVLKLYGEAVSVMKKCAAEFAKDGVYDALDDYKDVLARADVFSEDAAFALIP